jgi:hypothetical protein
MMRCDGCDELTASIPNQRGDANTAFLAIEMDSVSRLFVLDGDGDNHFSDSVYVERSFFEI